MNQQNQNTQTVETTECPLCGRNEGTEVSLRGRTYPGVYECTCGALHGSCYLGDSYALVSPRMDPNANQVGPEDQRYYDLECVGSAGLSRRHGWYNPATRMVTQVG